MGKKLSKKDISRNGSLSTRPDLIRQVRAALRRLTSEIDGVDQRAAARFGISRTDLRCIDVLRVAGSLTASELADAVGLTSGGLSIALERLERAGYVSRRRHPDDRRKVIVEATAAVAPLEVEIFGALGKRVAAVISSYDDQQLELIAGYLECTADAIAAVGPPSPSGKSPA